jgi:hypothetical protein
LKVEDGLPRYFKKVGDCVPKFRKFGSTSVISPAATPNQAASVAAQ